jgi:hypothetical protein
LQTFRLKEILEENIVNLYLNQLSFHSKRKIWTFLWNVILIWNIQWANISFEQQCKNSHHNNLYCNNRP